MVPRRRRIRRRRAGRAWPARPVRRHRALRQLHRRPAQVALRAVRLLRARLSRSAAGPPRPPAARRVPRRPPRRRGVEPAAISPITCQRHARGLPFWFSLAAHGTAAYREAVETTMRSPPGAARAIEDADHVELLLEPELSIVLFRRVGWTKPDYEALERSGHSPTGSPSSCRPRGSVKPCSGSASSTTTSRPPDREDLGESSGERASVEAAFVADRQLERLQCADQLVGATGRQFAFIGAFDGERSIVDDHSRWFGSRMPSMLTRPATMNSGGLLAGAANCHVGPVSASTRTRSRVRSPFSTDSSARSSRSFALLEVEPRWCRCRNQEDSRSSSPCRGVGHRRPSDFAIWARDTVGSVANSSGVRRSGSICWVSRICGAMACCAAGVAASSVSQRQGRGGVPEPRRQGQADHR